MSDGIIEDVLTLTLGDIWAVWGALGISGPALSFHDTVVCQSDFCNADKLMKKEKDIGRVALWPRFSRGLCQLGP